MVALPPFFKYTSIIGNVYNGVCVSLRIVYNGDQCMNENVFQVLTYLHNDGNAIFYEIGQDHIRSTGILHVALL